MGLLDAFKDEQFRDDLATNARNLAQSASNTVAGNFSGPVDGLAWLMRKAGMNVPSNPMMGSDWLQQQGLTAETQHGPSEMVGETLGLLAPIAMTVGAPKIAKGLLQMGDNLAAPSTMNKQSGAIVWHGSPHKFPPTAKNQLGEFDFSKVGTGEGGSGWGQGTYLTDSESVANRYSNPEFLKQAGGKTFTGPGYVYKTDIPDQVIGNMLNADASLSKQSNAVKKVFKEFLTEYEYTSASEAMNRAKLVSSQDFGKANSGNGIYEIMKHDLGSEAELINRLKSAGVTGTRYLDGGSRGAGAGSSNYVIFPGNEDLLSILERNGNKP